MSATTTPDPAVTRLRPERFSATRRRTIDAAMKLFGDHGVSGTSFQMVADAVGVTKAAIYHQFKTKEALVLAVAEVGLVPLEAALVESGRESSKERAREVLLTRVIDLCVSRRRWVNALQNDPVFNRLLLSYEPFVDLRTRLYTVLLDLAPDPSAQLRTAIASAAVLGALTHPVVSEIDDETLRVEVTALARRLFDL